MGRLLLAHIARTHTAVCACVCVCGTLCFGAAKFKFKTGPDKPRAGQHEKEKEREREWVLEKGRAQCVPSGCGGLGFPLARARSWWLPASLRSYAHTWWLQRARARAPARPPLHWAQLILHIHSARATCANLPLRTNQSESASESQESTLYKALFVNSCAELSVESHQRLTRRDYLFESRQTRTKFLCANQD